MVTRRPHPPGVHGIHEGTVVDGPELLGHSTQRLYQHTITHATPTSHKPHPTTTHPSPWILWECPPGQWTGECDVTGDVAGPQPDVSSEKGHRHGNHGPRPYSRTAASHSPVTHTHTYYLMIHAQFDWIHLLGWNTRIEPSKTAGTGMDMTRSKWAQCTGL